MSYFKTTTACAALLLLTACASHIPNTPRSKAQIQAGTRAQTYKTLLHENTAPTAGSGSMRVVTYADKETPNANPYNGNQLYLIRRSDSSKIVALKTLKLLATLTSGGSYQSSDKEELVGTPTQIPIQASQTLHNLIKDDLFKTYRTLPAATEQYDFMIDWKRVYLVYEKYNNQGDKGLYRLVQKIRFSKYYESEDNVAHPRAFTYQCEQRSAVKPLSEWQANHYQAVQTAAQAYAQECAQALLHTIAQQKNTPLY